MAAQVAGVKGGKRGNSKRLNELTPLSAGRTMDVHDRELIPPGRFPPRGRHGFDGGKDSWDACRAPSPRKSGGTQRNCEHAARSRCLIK
jgi:hypothetical protein